MTWLSILTNKWIAGPLAALALAAGLWLGGDLHGRHQQAAKDTQAMTQARETMDAALSATWTNWETIDQLRLANRHWASQAEISEVKAKQSANAVAGQAMAYSAALAKVQTKLKEAVNASPDARRIGAIRLPDAVLRSLCEHATDCPHENR